MIRLEELLYSLTTVIIRYHDNLMGKKLITAKDIPEARLKSRELAIAIIQNKDNGLDFSKKLENIIVNCTVGYADRQPFLYYILNEAVLINSFLNRKTSFTAEEFTEYKAQIYKLLIDIKGLLSTKKSGRYEVTRHQSDIGPKGDIALSGCINERYVGDYFCNSGIFLNQEVLETLNISYGFSEERFEEFADRICMEHQNALLVPEQQAKIVMLEEENSNQKQTLESFAPKLEEAQSSSAQQTDLLKQYEETIRQLKETMAQQAEQLKQQEEKISEQTTLLSEQTKLLNEQIQRPRTFFGGLAYNPALFALGRFPRVAEGTEAPGIGLASLGINE
ncbi:hypothetical protein [Legionella bononiensis]|uniref:Uncharacterized protein n=1 Tax=Legionella bononiensis TaxID=2793102 RepID=A0ABS1W8F5_9GAMM|nr:hypothetical protein [Legionella bononiensis]MBL7479836.1 hypothetical protein [Legionella bononiensis]MBL7525649.1 hypothetical protein [Legionella bononiensis]MBL7561832.1 hypothetical protein [Legionella bononiensis]